MTPGNAEDLEEFPEGTPETLPEGCDSLEEFRYFHRMKESAEFLRRHLRPKK